MNTINAFFENKVDSNNTISFLIEGKNKDNLFYNYLVRKIISQLEVRTNVYPLGPSMLIYHTKRILSPIIENKDPFILKKIEELDKNNSNYLICSDAYYKKISDSSFNYSNEVFLNKLKQYIPNIKQEELDIHYNNLKKWIEININDEEEKQCFIDSYNKYFESVKHFNEYINNLKTDIKTNYDMYNYIFINNFVDKSLLEIIECIRNNMINKMLVKGDNSYRSYDLHELKKNSEFFKMTSKYETINNQMNDLNKEYEEIKQIEDIDDYLNRITIIFQKFVKIHPFVDGNGRTSRLLLDIMLLNRNILPPILYETNYDRKNLDNPAQDYIIRNDKKYIIEFIKKRIIITNSEYEFLLEENNFRKI